MGVRETWGLTDVKVKKKSIKYTREELLIEVQAFQQFRL
jgi:hypothetical protein